MFMEGGKGQKLVEARAIRDHYKSDIQMRKGLQFHHPDLVLYKISMRMKRKRKKSY
ncbi:hypothetical protein F2Q68_00004654 [Brassica cretica]|uniref:Uncharacterized protein n=1 Tax=Brassica cretica TaxID=69181 RepID=A0A8S9JLI3_BRACR|nr:hypothetical protein F2Q68_00004654 [Brassica cretica]